MFCANCGTQVKEGAAFCGNCGTPVQGTATPGQQPAPPSNQQQVQPQQAAGHVHTGAFTGSKSDQMKANAMEALSDSVLKEIHEGYKEKSNSHEPASAQTSYYCPDCGKEIPALSINYDNGTAFCSCGSKQLLIAQLSTTPKQTPQAAAVMTTPPVTTKPLLPILIAAAALVVVAGITVLFLVKVDDVYLCGQEGVNAVYWKNGKIVRLPVDAKESGAQSIYVNDGDIFVAGIEKDIIINKDLIVGSAKYWKNGERN
jgi:DNA-directed RNA polymerase subunit RPC12/RpoP